MTLRRQWWTAPYWTVVGVLGGFGVVSALTIGAYVLAVAAALVAVGASVPVLRSGSWPLAIAGSAAGPWYVGWLNRGGPGTVCEAIAGGVQCRDEWSPWPFAVVGIVAVVAGVSVLAVVRRRPEQAVPAAP